MKILKRKTLAALLVLSLLASLLPVGAVPALADAPANLYVGDQVCGSEISCWTTNSETGGLTEYTEGGDDWNVKYDPNTATLTLKNATIKTTTSHSQGAVIYAHSVVSSAVSLTINLEGTNKIECNTASYGIYVNAEMSNDNYGTDASLTITGTGSLDVSGSSHGIYIKSGTDNASLTIENASVDAETTQTDSGYAGVYVMSSIKATGSPNLSLAVNGGNLTASGTESNDGILFYVGSSQATGATTSLTVSENAIVRAENGIKAYYVDEPTPSGTGIVFDGTEGTVYGDVTLQEDLEIGEGESLTLDDGASLSAGDHNVIVDGGTLDESLANSLGDRVKYAPAITTPPADKSVTEGETATFTVNATGSEPLSYQWQQSTDKGSSWTNINSATSATYAITNTTKDMSGTQYRCVVTGSGVSVISSAATLTVNALTTYTINATANPAEGGTVTVNGGETSATVTEGSEATLTATVNEGWRFAGWMENGQLVSNETTYTITANGNRTLTAEFEKVYNVTVNSTAGGTATADKTTAAEGETVTLTATPNSGYHFAGWNVVSGTVTIQDKQFIMPANDVDIQAIFARNTSPTIPPTVSEKTIDAIQDAQPGETVTVDLSSGSTKLDKEVFETLAGKDVTLVVDLGDDVSWTVNGSDIPEDATLTDIDMGVTMNSDGIPVDVVNAITGERDTVQMTLAHDGDFGFTMTLTAPLGVENAGYWANLYHYDEDADQLTFETAAEIDADGSVAIPFSHASQYAIVIDTHSHATVDVSDLFIDIAPDAWYKDAIQYAYDNGLMTGVSATEFAPEATTTRAMIVSILARLENVTTAEAAGFADVDDEWYATAVNWAANVGVVNGYEDNTFQPNTAITREQLAAILMNYAAYKGEDVSNRADLTTYTDQPSTWAQEAMQWAVAEGLISGVTNDQLQPQSSATRAQVAAILQRLLEA